MAPSQKEAKAVMECCFEASENGCQTEKTRSEARHGAEKTMVKWLTV